MSAMLPRHRLSVTTPLQPGGELTLTGNPAHYISHVLRMKPGDTIAIFYRTGGEFSATITHIGKREITLTIGAPLRPPAPAVGLTVCFVPIKGGRLETIIEKATELGADVLQPVFSARSVVDKFNPERAESIAREAAEQCERSSWPEILPPQKLATLLGAWPADMPLIYGDESGGGLPIAELKNSVAVPTRWAVLAGPEGGFAPDERAMLTKISSATGVGLGPRILRADTAIITLCAATLMAWGDWHQPPRFVAHA